VCANDRVVVVSDDALHRVAVFDRGDGALLRWLGSPGAMDGQLSCLQGLCMMRGDRHVAVVDCNNDRVCVFSQDGAFVRYVGVDVLDRARGVASESTAADEIVVADNVNDCLRLFDRAGNLWKTAL
jgi:hypothetical protein